MALSIRQTPASAGNYNRGRNVLIDTVVMHVEEGSEKGTVATFYDPTRHASAHYGVGADGGIDQFVQEADTAWHSGNTGMNRRSIGIELEGYTATLSVTPPQFAAAVELVGEICMRYQIPIDRQHLIGHSEVPDPFNPTLFGGAGHHTDPGVLFPWDQFVAAVAAFVASPLSPPVSS